MKSLTSGGAFQTSEETLQDRLSQAPEPIQLAIEGRDRVFLYEYEEPQSTEELARDFDMYADFSVDNYPVIFHDCKLVLLVRGNHDDAANKVYTALWEAPPDELLPFGLPPTDYYGLHRPIEFGRVKLGWRISEIWADPDLGDPEVHLVSLGDYLRVSKVDERLYGTLPHPDTLVIAVMSRAPDRSRAP